jgi:hypothetical protein
MRAGVGLEVAEGLHLTGHFSKCVLAAPALAAVVGVRFCAGIVAHPVDLWALNCAALLVAHAREMGGADPGQRKQTLRATVSLP